jgi:hypothetical protein
VSYSNYLKVLDPHYERENPGFVELRTRAKEILQKERELAEIVQLVGKSALGESEKITLDVAGMLKVSQSGAQHAGSTAVILCTPLTPSGRLPPAERYLRVRPILPLLQDGRYAPQLCLVLRAGPARRRVERHDVLQGGQGFRRWS